MLALKLHIVFQHGTAMHRIIRISLPHMTSEHALRAGLDNIDSEE